MLRQVVQSQPSVKYGFQDGGHTILECSNCRIPLVDVFVIQPDQDFDWKCKAKCCYCGDMSFEKNVHGLFRYSGAQKPSEGEDTELVTQVTHLESEGQSVLFHTAPGTK
jgi:hypothetical protein